MGEMASRLFKKSTKEWNAWRRHNPHVELDFSGENLCNSSLVGADLRRIKFDEAELCDVDLSKADLSRTSLKATLLQRAKLNRADLQDADLRKADLQWAILDNANLSRATLEEANLEYAKLNRAILDGANLRATTAMGAELNGASLIHVDLDGADFVGCSGQSAQIDQASLIATDLSRGNLAGATIRNSSLHSVILDNARLAGASFAKSMLREAKLRSSDLTDSDFSETDLTFADLSGARLLRTNFSGARLNGANLSMCQIVQADFSGADISGCSIHGMSAWGLNLKGATQSDLLITRPDEPDVFVDNLELAQFIYLLLSNKKIRDVIDGITSKLVLILGRFTSNRKSVLDRLRAELRRLGYAPVLFDFEKPSSRDLTETISTLAHMSRFILADITDARSIPQELTSIVPNLPSVPVQPLLQADSTEYGMFEHFQRYPWVLDVHNYRDAEGIVEDLTFVVESLERKIIDLKNR